MAITRLDLKMGIKEKIIDSNTILLVNENVRMSMTAKDFEIFTRALTKGFRPTAALQKAMKVARRITQA